MRKPERFWNACAAEEQNEASVLTRNQHLTGFLIPQRHLSGLDRLGRLLT